MLDQSHWSNVEPIASEQLILHALLSLNDRVLQLKSQNDQQNGQ